MTRFIVTALLTLSIALFGVLPHAAMAGQMQKTAAPCHSEQTVMSGHADATKHCGGSDHSMSDACAIACFVSIATWFTSADAAQMAFRPVAHRATVSLVFRGRTGETADRPPKFL